jgi:hypothetical protein
VAAAAAGVGGPTPEMPVPSPSAWSQFYGTVSARIYKKLDWVCTYIYYKFVCKYYELLWIFKAIETKKSKLFDKFLSTVFTFKFELNCVI